MGILVEFNPDLALRNFSECEAGRRKAEECVPQDLIAGKTYSFLKRGQRNYWLRGEVPLVETKGNEDLSSPLAAVEILEVTHTVQDGEVYTKGTYRVTEVIPAGTVRFNGLTKL